MSDVAEVIPQVLATGGKIADGLVSLTSNLSGERQEQVQDAAIAAEVARRRAPQLDAGFATKAATREDLIQGKAAAYRGNAAALDAAKIKMTQLQATPPTGGWWDRFTRWRAQSTFDSATKDFEKSAKNFAKAQASAARGATFDGVVGKLRPVLRKAGWAAGILALADGISAYKENGIRGVASAGIDLVTVGVPSTIGGAVGGTVGSFVTPIVGTAAGAVGGGLLGGQLAEEYLLPYAHGLEAYMGLPVKPDAAPERVAPLAAAPSAPIVPGQQQTPDPHATAEQKPNTKPADTKLADTKPADTKPAGAEPTTDAAQGAKGPAPAAKDAGPAALDAKLAAEKTGEARFDFNSADMTAADKTALLEADRKLLQGHAGKLVVEIKGHVDSVGGNSARNRFLADARAQAAAAVMEQAVDEAGKKGNVQIIATGAGLGQGATADQQRNATVSLRTETSALAASSEAEKKVPNQTPAAATAQHTTVRTMEPTPGLSLSAPG